jgi:hypothetical protein
MYLKKPFFALPLLFSLAQPALAVPVGTSADTRPAAPQHRPRWKEGGISLNVAGNYLRGNVNLSTVNTSLNLNVNRGRHQFFIDAGNFYSATDTTVLVNRLAGSTLYAYSVADNQNVYAYTTHSYDQSIKLDYRLTTGLGWCWHRLFEPYFSLFLISVNPAYEYELFQNNVTASALRGVFRVNAIKPVTDTIETGFDGFYTPALADLGDLRLYGEAYLKAKLIGDIVSLKLTLADEYDSRPQPGIQSNDVGVFTTLTAEWGQ